MQDNFHELIYYVHDTKLIRCRGNGIKCVFLLEKAPVRMFVVNCAVPFLPCNGK